MKILIDRNIYSDECVSKTIYELSNLFSFQRKQIGENEELTIHEKSTTFDETRFLDILNDFKLRTIIANETKEIRTILFAKAFADFDELTEDDLQD